MIGFCSDDFSEMIRKIHSQILEEKEKTLAEIITKYDFIVGSKDLQERLLTILPEGANIVYSQYIEDPTHIYAIKKFDVMDYITFNTAFELKNESG